MEISEQQEQITKLEKIIDDKTKKIESLEHLLKEKDLQVEEEVRNKLIENKKVLSYQEKLRLMANLVKVNEEKLIEIVRKVVNLYGKEIVDKKH
tara:strand:- start:205 stop:486 length:282 start_codon:yes stop_codon:yes gene_type:complete